MTRCVLTDTHLGIYKDSEVWLKVTKKLFIKVAETCKKRNIKTIYHLGDWFHNRKEQNTKTTNISLQIARILEDFDVYVLVGNHDTYYQNKIVPTSLQIFNKHKNITVIDKPTLVNNDALFPWKTTENDIESVVRIHHPQICYGHFEIKNSYMNKMLLNYGGLDPDVFKPFKKVFSGHFHTSSTNKNIKYIGSPFQQTFEDYDEKRGYYIIDDDGNTEFIEFTDYPHFIKIVLNSEIVKSEKDIEKFSNTIKGNIVRVTFQEDMGTKWSDKVLSMMLNMGPLQLSTSFSPIDDTTVQINANEEDMEFDEDKIIEKFINKTVVPKHISKKLAISMAKQMMKQLDEDGSGYKETMQG